MSRMSKEVSTNGIRQQFQRNGRILPIFAVLLLCIGSMQVQAQKPDEKKGVLDKVGDTVDALRGKPADADMMKMNMDMLNKNIADWPADHKETVQKLMEKYGPPDESTPTMVMWHNMDMTKPKMGPFKHIHVFKGDTMHDFPATHKDYLLSVINYMVPPEKASELAMFDGSIKVDRTEGELKAKCDKEENNILGLNLAHQIIIGKMTVAEARKAFSEAAVQAKMGKMPEMMQRLMFEPAMSGTMDPDVMTIGKDGMVMSDKDMMAMEKEAMMKNKDKMKMMRDKKMDMPKTGSAK